MTDKIINSLIQSPLVRTLQSIPTNSDSFVHGIPDNTPPFSKHTVQLSKVAGSGDEKDLDGVQSFRIPQNGYLNRLYCRYRMRGQIIKDKAVEYLDSQRDPLKVAGGLESVTLRTHNNIIQTIPGDVIPFEIAGMSQDASITSRAIDGILGYTGGDNDGVYIQSGDKIYARLHEESKADDADDYWRGAVLDFIIPIPLSSTFYMKDNFQTRFIEDLEVDFKMKRHHRQSTSVGINGAEGLDLAVDPLRHELEVFAVFTNWHENVEQVIRNVNYKPGVPAALLQSDFLTFDRTSAPSTYDANAKITTWNYNLSSDALVSDIIVVPYKLVADAANFPINGQWIPLAIPTSSSLYLTLRTSDQVLMEGHDEEIQGIEAMPYSSPMRQFQGTGVLPFNHRKSGVRMRLGWNNTDEFYDGGISFASLINPSLEIRMYGDSAAYKDEIKFKVYLKRKVMIRIDSDTGYIEKSLTS